MKNKYSDLIEQTFEFPQEEFKIVDGELYFHEIPLMDLVSQYGTPLKITYLPKIGEQIQKDEPKMPQMSRNRLEISLILDPQDIQQKLLPLRGIKPKPT